MLIKVAETAGFCFGVDRAVNLVYKLLDNGTKVATLGPIIHNPQLVDDLQSHGVVTVNSIDEVPEGYTVVIRTHGVPKNQVDIIKENNSEYCDATCPFVSKIHKIVFEKGTNDGIVLIAGDKNHPEVEGIVGYCRGQAFVFGSSAELENVIKNNKIQDKSSVVCVSQTTFSVKEWKNCVKILKKLCTNALIFDTICSATSERQSEAVELSINSDAMVVIGGRHSSNTNKLKDVSAVNCPTFLVEKADELKNIDFSQFTTVGVTAGASTPAGIIKEVLQTMSEIQETKIEKEVETTSTTSSEVAETAEFATKATIEPAVEASAGGEMSFAEMLEESFKSVTTDQKVKGTVVRITPTEIQVDVEGRKQTGFVSVDELTTNPNEKAEDVVSVGDVLDLIIMKTNDQDGTIMLSKRRFDAIRGWDDIVKANADDEVLEGVVSSVVRGGLLVSTKGVRVFVPASLATLNRNDNLDDLVNTTVNFKVIEINEQRRRAVASIKAVLSDARKEIEEEFWQKIAEGQTFTGVVKSLTSYGAFVDLGGVDGMVHISELSWKRIKHPSEVVAVGDNIEVYVKALDQEKRKISLGFKKLEDNPWEVLRTRFPEGTVVTAKVVGLTAFGAFANIIPGIDGLIHISQIANQHVKNPADLLEIGQEVQAQITEINFDKRRVSLSMRALLPEEDLEGEVVETVAEEVVEAPIAEEATEE